MNSIATTGIVLSRLNFGEADKIITIITPDYGKLRLMARGVRKERSKLAGGIELFSVSSISYIPGKKDIGTLISTRLITHWGKIVEDIARTMTAYDVLKLLNKVTEDQSESEYYQLILHTLSSLDMSDIMPQLVKCWFYMQLLKLQGHAPNLERDTYGVPLMIDKRYQFNYEDMGFMEQIQGQFDSNYIKVLRLLLRETPQKMSAIKDLNKLLPAIESMLQHAVRQHLTTSIK